MKVERGRGYHRGGNKLTILRNSAAAAAGLDAGASNFIGGGEVESKRLRYFRVINLAKSGKLDINDNPVGGARS